MTGRSNWLEAGDGSYYARREALDAAETFACPYATTSPEKWAVAREARLKQHPEPPREVLQEIWLEAVAELADALLTIRWHLGREEARLVSILQGSGLSAAQICAIMRRLGWTTWWADGGDVEESET